MYIINLLSTTYLPSDRKKIEIVNKMCQVIIFIILLLYCTLLAISVMCTFWTPHFEKWNLLFYAESENYLLELFQYLQFLTAVQTRKNKLTRKNDLTTKHILYLKMCFLVDLFFLVNLFFSYWLLHEAALDLTQ